jgi:signal transduction histidine kinase
MIKMRDEKKTKKQLINELIELRKVLAEREESKTGVQEAEEKLQKKLIEYEKLSALGRLTANVAHEIRNPITVIGGLTERLKKTIPHGTKEKEYLELISLEAKRLEEILKDVLVFSNKPFFLKEKQDINKIIEESLDAYEDAYKRYLIKIHKYFGNVTQVYIDKRLVKEAISNLISNAIDAMPDGGTLTIVTSEDSLSGKNYVTVKVIDTGVGISEENIRMIFEPFFTTKVAKKETGLGLPITKKIVEGHGGFIKVDSSAGKGSTFSLFFPYRTK